MPDAVCVRYAPQTKRRLGVVKEVLPIKERNGALDRRLNHRHRPIKITPSGLRAGRRKSSGE